MNITFFDIKEKEQKDFLKNNLRGHKLQFFEKPCNQVPTTAYKQTEILVVFIHSRVDKQIIDKLPKLKCILTQSTGFDHLDLKYIKEKGLKVGNVPFYGENTVAEHTFALMLNLARNIHKSYLRTKQDNFSIEGLQGFDLKGKTLGVIGVGHIGLHVIKMAKGFGMHVKAYDIHQDHFITDVLHFEYASLEEILKTSDILSLHMPLFESTHHFLDEKKIKQTKKGVMIVNTSRGGLIDSKALFKYLNNGHIGGAGLDVIEGEELIEQDRKSVV